MKLEAAIKGFLMDWELRGRSDKTLGLYRSTLLVFARWLAGEGIQDVEEVTIAHLRAFMLHTQTRPADSVNPKKHPAANGRTLSTSSLQGYVKSIKVLFHWLVDEEVLVKNPSLRLQKPTGAKRVKVTLKPDHLTALFGVCDLSNSLGFRDYTMMLVLLDAGIRISELCDLQLESMHDGFLMIFGKGRKEREVGISPTTAKFLWKYINMHRVAEDDSVTALFTGVRGEPLRPSGARKIVERIKLAAGIEDIPVTPHKFRHTFARSWLEKGGEVYSLSRLLGHSSVKVTETYLEDFTSRQARVHHVKFSALNDLKVRKQGRGRHHYRHYKQLPSEEEGNDETTDQRE